MKNSRSSIRYAKALLGLSEENKCLQQTYADMVLIKKTCDKNKDLQLLLKSPIVKTDQKIKILKQVFSKNISNLTGSFIDLIVAKKREAFLHTITEQFINIYKKQSNIETVKIKTATPISDVLKNDIIRFVKHNNKNIVDVETQEIIDPKIIGGVVIDMGGVRFDTSISKSINELRKKFNQNLYIKDY
tara:strand:+ start:794 stop:1357 length:564 start_codon:yes stop_codon:yes gene_type:complete